MRLAILLGLAIACASCAMQPSASDANEDARDAPWLELGTGLMAYEALPDEDATLELVQGPQGGWHVHLSLRAHDFAPTGLTYEITRVRDGRVVCLLPLGVREGTFVRRDDVIERVGDFAIFDVHDPAEVLGEAVVVRATLYDASTRSIEDVIDARIVDEVE
ncbi:MAG: hypothetical protein J0L92_12710 [Deltaproteobacteria bacterium]|nr:hypothetical protein [Deltaproteobacteria bacterium]